MNQVLIDFYTVQFKSTHLGYSFRNIIAFSNKEFEQAHDVIQWLFPLPVSSQYNKFAPILDFETIVALKENYLFRTNFFIAFEYFMEFLKATEANWIEPNNHNFKRITRAIKSLTLLGRPKQARELYTYAVTKHAELPLQIPFQTVMFWNEALNSKALTLKDPPR